MADKIQFYPLDIAYKIEKEKPIIYLFGTTSDKKKICVVDENFNPYFFVILKNQDDISIFREKMQNNLLGY